MIAFASFKINAKFIIWDAPSLCFPDDQLNVFLVNRGTYDESRKIEYERVECKYIRIDVYML